MAARPQNSRSKRKQARERQRRADQRGLGARGPSHARKQHRGTPASAPALPPQSESRRAPEKSSQRARLPVLVKVAAFVAVLVGAIWVFSRLRQEQSGVSFPAAEPGAAPSHDKLAPAP